MKLLMSGCIALVFTLCLQPTDNGKDDMVIALPDPNTSGDISLETTLQQRRSVREYIRELPGLEEVGQLAWAAQGITDPARGFRTAPSAGATFPIEIYLLINGVDDVPDGIYRYNNGNHTLELTQYGDRRADLHQVALGQDPIIQAPVVMVITGVLENTRQRYGDRALRYMHMESGHVAQNVYLQGVALDIGTVVIGAFDDDGVREVLELDEGEHPLYIMPLGKTGH